MNAKDPYGYWALFDDAIATVGGAAGGVGAQGLADLATGRVSSWKSYVAAGVGGAAGGEAALYTGGLASGAVGGGAYSLTKQALSGSFNLRDLALETGISSITAGIGSYVLPAAAKQLSNSVKGTIGEWTSMAYNWMKGSTLIDTQVKGVRGLSTVIDSAWENLSGAAYYVESKFGKSTLTKAQGIAQDVLGDAYHVERWGYDWVGSVGATGGNSLGLGISSAYDSWTNSAAGGYLIYPNKTNTNMMQSVYSK